MEHNWTDEQMIKAQNIVMERFALNSVAGHLAPRSTVEEMATTVTRNRFDFAQAIVIDREVFGLNEPFSFCRFSKAQVNEFSAMQGEDVTQTKVVTTLTRASSNFARVSDALFVVGFDEMESRGLRPPSVEMPRVDVTQNPPQSLREAAIEAEGTTGVGPIVVIAPFNEGLVTAVYEAVLRLEGRGYFTAYHLVLGEQLWQELHRPTPGSMVLPRYVIEPTLMGGGFYRTTTLRPEEALLASLDGPTFDYVIAGDPARHPLLEWLRVESSAARNREEIYTFRISERSAPRVRENQAIVRMTTKP
ncbi:MAG: encapsulin [Chromatiales bacterium]